MANQHSCVLPCVWQLPQVQSFPAMPLVSDAIYGMSQFPLRSLLKLLYDLDPCSLENSSMGKGYAWNILPPPFAFAVADHTELNN